MEDEGRARWGFRPAVMGGVTKGKVDGVDGEGGRRAREIGRRGWGLGVTSQRGVLAVVGLCGRSLGRRGGANGKEISGTRVRVAGP